MFLVPTVVRNLLLNPLKQKKIESNKNKQHVTYPKHYMHLLPVQTDIVMVQM